MHWLIVGKSYDHKDRNPMNNRRYNLRSASDVENSRNRSISSKNKSGIMGVYWKKSLNKWAAQISIDKKRTHLGYYDIKEDAIRARLNAESKYYKDFAPQRNLFNQYGIFAEQSTI